MWICHTAISRTQQQNKEEEEEQEDKEEEPSGLFSKRRSIRSSLVLQEWRRSLRLPIQTASLLSQWKPNSCAPPPQTITCFCISVTSIYLEGKSHIWAFSLGIFFLFLLSASPMKDRQESAQYCSTWDEAYFTNALLLHAATVGNACLQAWWLKRTADMFMCGSFNFFYPKGKKIGKRKVLCGQIPLNEAYCDSATMCYLRVN